MSSEQIGQADRPEEGPNKSPADGPKDGADGDQWREVEAALAQAMAPESAGRSKAAKRERVVLAERRNSRRVVRTLADVEQQTGVGELYVRELMQAQLNLALRLMALTTVVLGGLVVGLLVLPLGAVGIGGLLLPWLVLGLAVYPFLIAVAWSYTRRANRNEQDFTEMVEN